MKVLNGIRVYEPGEAIKLPDGYPSIPSNDPDARFGYKLIEDDGSRRWTYASEEEYRSLQLRLSVPLEEVEADIKIRLSKMKVPCGFNANHVCVGECGLYAGACRGQENPTNHNHIVSCSCLGAGN